MAEVNAATLDAHFMHGTCTAHMLREFVGIEPLTRRASRRSGADPTEQGGIDPSLCDTDPLKLHYHFCLMRIGVVGLGQMRTDVRAAGEAMSRQRLGIADLVLCEIPEGDVLEQRRRSDPERSRRRFDLHRRPAGPLQEWYAALADLDPDRVQWRYPDVLPAVGLRNRYDLRLFDAWMAELGLARRDASIAGCAPGGVE